MGLTVHQQPANIQKPSPARIEMVQEGRPRIFHSLSRPFIEGQLLFLPAIIMLFSCCALSCYVMSCNAMYIVVVLQFWLMAIASQQLNSQKYSVPSVITR